MRVTRKALLVLAGLLGGGLGPAAALTPPLPQRAPADVLDFYRLLPAECLFPEGVRPDREQAVKIKDVPNGYLRLEGTWEGYTEVALFRKADGSALIGVILSECGPGCQQKVRFLEWDGAAWRDRTGEVLPEVTPAMLAAAYRAKKETGDEDFGQEVPAVYVLPRRGTMVRIQVQPEFSQREIILFELKWNRQRFELQP